MKIKASKRGCEKMKKPVIKRNYAVALSYDADKHPAPKVIGKGRGLVADKMIEKAKMSQIPVYKDEKLVQKLQTMNMDEYISPELYEAVAQILVFISGVDSNEIG